MFGFLLEASGPSLFANLLLIGGVVIIMFFTMIYPQMQQAQKDKKFRNSLKIGDRVVTMGGIIGKIHKIEDGTVLLEVDNNVRIRMEIAAIRMHSNSDVAKK